MIDVEDLDTSHTRTGWYIEDQSVEEMNFTPVVFVNYHYNVVQRRC